MSARTSLVSILGFDVTARQPRGGRTWSYPSILALALLALAILAVRGWAYYGLPASDRFDAPLHPQLRSSGTIGHLYGYVGLALVLGNLLYLVRRRFAHVEGFGSMRAWMRWHVLSGLVGGGFILLHSAFLLRTWPAIVSSASLLVVMVTGLFGRYLYRLLPRGPDGRPRAPEALAGDVDHALIALRGLGPGALDAATLVETRVEEAVRVAGGHHGGGLGAVTGTLRALWHLRGLGIAARRVARNAGADADAARDVGPRRAGSAGWCCAPTPSTPWRPRARRGAGSTRAVAIVMLVTASLHVSVAIYLGFAT